MTLHHWENAPICETLSAILRAAHGQDAVCCRRHGGVRERYLVLSYREDFAYLWEQVDAADGILDAGQELSIVLIWDGMPKANSSIKHVINVDDHLTAFDWVVTLCCNAAKKRERPKIRIFILDLTPRAHISAFGCRSFSSFVPRVPWLRVYRPSTPLEETIREIAGAVPGAGAVFSAMARVDAIGADEFLRDICLQGPFLVDLPYIRDDPGLSETARLLKEVWSSKLTNVQSRHSVANLIGPQVLLSSMTKPAGSLIPADAKLAALFKQMEALDLVSESEGRHPPPWIPVEIFQTLQQTAFVLVDDLHEFGWSRFLRVALGIRSDRLSAFDRADDASFGANGATTLVGLLADNGRLRVNRGITLRPNTNDDVILFLDLRLFGQRTSREEMDFFRELTPLAKQAIDDNGGRSDLPWPGFTTNEVLDAEKCVGQELVETEEYFTALTLLPRLLAIVDPQLPIVLFSSTGQRHIIEALKPYQTIITDFDKPRYFGTAEQDISGEVRMRFETAVAAAARIRRTRIALRRLSPGASSATGSSTLASLGSQRAPYVEIFVDEARVVTDQDFRVGGLAIVYDDKASADEFNQEIIRRGVQWGSTDVEPAPTGRLLRKEDRREVFKSKVFDIVEPILRGQFRQPIAFSLQRPANVPWVDPGDLSSPWCVDNLYRRLVVQALEVLLYECLRAHVGTPQFDCAVYVGTRARFRTAADTPDAWKNFADSYGVQCFSDATTGDQFFLASSRTAFFP